MSQIVNKFIIDGAITLAKLAPLAANSVIANATGSSATPTALTLASANTVSSVVFRDSSGNFSAGTITATLSGNATNVTGTVAIANGGSGQTTATASFNALSPLTTKGDLLSNDATNDVRLAVGTDGQLLQADSASTAGVKWASVSAYTKLGARAHNSSTTITSSLATIVWTTEDYDYGSNLSSGVFTVPTGGDGLYMVCAHIVIAATYSLNNANGFVLRKNGTVFASDTFYAAAVVTELDQHLSDAVACVAGDTLDVQASSQGTSPTITSNNNKNYFTVVRMSA